MFSHSTLPYSSLSFSPSPSFVTDRDSYLSVFGLFWAPDKWFIHHKHFWCFATVGMFSYSPEAWHVDVYLPHKLQMWTHWLDIWLEELSWKNFLQPLTWNIQWIKEKMVGDTLEFYICHRFKSVSPPNTTYLILLNVCEFKPQQSEDSKPSLPLGGNAVADWHDRRETNTCGITTSHFPLSPCCPLMCPKSVRMCYIAI